MVGNMELLLLSVLSIFASTIKADDHQHSAGEATSQGSEKLNAKLKFTTHDIHHIKEHLKEDFGINDEKANKYLAEYDHETQFFMMHDYDKNGKLDGLEILTSHTHLHEDEHVHTNGTDGSSGSSHGSEAFTDHEASEVIDEFLKRQDVNNNGYIEYPEYIVYFERDKKGEK